MMATTNKARISISMDEIWAGSGDLVDGRIENCGAQFCDDNEESLSAYELIEKAIEAGRASIMVHLDGETHVLSWSIAEPMENE